jgi:hypothetical protein
LSLRQSVAGLVRQVASHVDLALRGGAQLLAADLGFDVRDFFDMSRAHHGTFVHGDVLLTVTASA